jgi:hypothetical protein
MKRKPLFGILVGIFVSLAIILPADEPVPQPADSDSEPLGSALDRAETSRKQAQDIDAPGYFPPDWDAAEGQYASAAEARNAGEAQEAIALYEAAAAAYDALARQSVPLYYRELSATIVQARDEAIDAGIRDISPDRLEAADLRVDEALERYRAGGAADSDAAAAENYYASAAAAFDALDRYKALSLGVRAYGLREEIGERGFADYDAEDYQLAEDSLDGAIAAYDDGDTDGAGAGAEEAFLRYSLVMGEGWLSIVGDMKQSAEAERRKALDAKADVAVKQEFGDADGLYSRAAAAYDAQDYAAASELFSRSLPLFAAAANSAEQKRLSAQEAIQAAEARIGQSEETAREAEIVLQGGAQ